MWRDKLIHVKIHGGTVNFRAGLALSKPARSNIIKHTIPSSSFFSAILLKWA
jgi:hypothetical protein